MITATPETAEERHAHAETLIAAGADRDMLIAEAKLMVGGFRTLSLRAGGASQEGKAFERDMNEWLDYLALLMGVSS